MDVSGSIYAVIGILGTVLKEKHKEGLVRLFAFSTVVDEVTPKSIKKGIQNTLGTDIDCVLDHLIATDPNKRPKRVLIVTDGYVGLPAANKLAALKNLKFIVGLTKNGYSNELDKIAEIIRLPI